MEKYSENGLLISVFYFFLLFFNLICLLENGIIVGNLIFGYVRGVCNIIFWFKLIGINFLKILEI